MFCTKCGIENLADARFCEKCGHAMHRDEGLG
ncbi:MAG: zinc-ribbon domain-containing protein [Thermodesulfobacteriota bacterium]